MTWFEIIEETQVVLVAYLVGYNTKRPHQGRDVNGKAPNRAFRDSITMGAKKEATTTPTTAACPLPASDNCQVISISVRTVQVSEIRPG